MNTFGERFRLTTYGESHGPAVGGIIDGCPAGLRLDMEAIRRELDRRRQGAPRPEEDEVVFLSGLRDGVSLGIPIAFEIRNTHARPADYAQLEHCFRPGHADYTYYKKYGLRDHRGGGRASARETVVRVVAGSIARQLLPGITITSSVHIPLEDHAPTNDTLGGTVRCRITGVPAGVGDPIFDKLNARLAYAMMSIPSAIGFAMGHEATLMLGSEYIDRWCGRGEEEKLTKTNHCGGVQGGISNGMPVEFTVTFHPVVTLPQPVECLTEEGTLTTVDVGGRHDRSHVRRAAVVVEAMAAMVFADYLCGR